MVFGGGAATGKRWFALKGLSNQPSKAVRGGGCEREESLRLPETIATAPAESKPSRVGQKEPEDALVPAASTEAWAREGARLRPAVSPKASRVAAPSEGGVLELRRPALPK
jgi:hypothetical protein